MYLLLFALLAGIGAWLAYTGADRGHRPRTVAGLGLIGATVLFFALLSFWGEMLWFDALGYGGRFWTLVATRVGAVGVGALVPALVVWLAVRSLQPRERIVVHAAWALAAGAGLLWGLQAWDELLLFLHGEATGVAEPILNRDVGFYLFNLPLFERLYYLLLATALIVAAASWASVWQPRGDGGSGPWRRALVATAAVGLALALGRVLEAFQLLFSDWGVVHGPGWTDAHVRLPAYFIVAVLIAVGSALPLWPRFRAAVGRRLPADGRWLPGAPAAAVAWAGVGVVWFLGLSAAPNLVQWLVVEPNEITYERPYIVNNIAFTRRGFRLHDVEERAFPAREQFDRQTAAANQGVLDDVRLWDWRALDSVFKQFQEIRLYYEFHNVDIDRYTLGDGYRQVMVSARELDQNNLPAQSQTFVNRRFKYTHGYGAAMAPVSEFTESGLPRLLLKDIPPKAAHDSLQLDRPQIYYGELTDGPAVGNSSEREFDHPRGEQNAYTHYAGSGGVPIDSLWRKFVFGWMFDGTRLLLSSYPDRDSRMLFRRDIGRRVRALAPFLRFDADPYVVVSGGRLKWVIDAYTLSRHYPYSEPFSSAEFIEYRNGNARLGNRVAAYLNGANYVRNSVKAVVDAYDGSVDFYVFDDGDPLVRAWRRAFPDLFKPRATMPEALQAHVRYPEGFLLAQGLVYAKYHMQDPEVFYNQEDLWVRATEKYYGRVQPVEPYYVMWKRPGTEEKEFVPILPFTPKNRQVLIGWIAGMCDGENYGRFIAYQFPKEKRVLGPQQVETKIDQDPQLSGQLTLWDQRGSQVIRGNVLAIPIEETLLYVEPIYLQAETAAYPELRLVVLMHGDTLSYAETFDEALQGLFEGGVREVPRGGAVSGTLREMAAEADRVFQEYLRLQGQGEFERAAERFRRLQRLLEQMNTDGE